MSESDGDRNHKPICEHIVDSGAILELAVRVKGLTELLERDRVDRQRERTEDRVAMGERFLSVEARQKALEDLVFKYPDGMAHAVVANTAKLVTLETGLNEIDTQLNAYPNGMSHATNANTAGRHRARVAFLLLATPTAALIIKAVIENIGR